MILGDLGEGFFSSDLSEDGQAVLAGTNLGSNLGLAGKGATILLTADKELRAINKKIMGSSAPKAFRRSWNDFYLTWRQTFDEYGQGRRDLSAVETRLALGIQNEGRSWLANLDQELEGVELGIDYGALWKDVKTATSDYLHELPKAIVEKTENAATSALQPTVQKAVERKASVVASKGQVMLFAGIGLAAGALVAGGSIERRVVGGAIGGILGGLAGFKVGLVSDSQ